VDYRRWEEKKKKEKKKNLNEDVISDCRGGDRFLDDASNCGTPRLLFDRFQPDRARALA